MSIVLVLSCEHAGMQIPKVWQPRVCIPKIVLESHRGWDPGALELTKELSKAGAVEVFCHSVTRLLIELNRSLGHPKLFSEFSKHLSGAERKLLIENLYQPYRHQVSESIRKHSAKGKTVWHISVHTFTPELDGHVREAEVGLLYDPRRPGEKQFATQWQRALRASLGSDVRVRMNYPYRGIADGFVTKLRKLFPQERYVGIELEVNQGLRSNSTQWRRIKTALRDTLENIK